MMELAAALRKVESFILSIGLIPFAGDRKQNGDFRNSKIS